MNAEYDFRAPSAEFHPSDKHGFKPARVHEAAPGNDHFFDVGAMLSFLLRNKRRILIPMLICAALAAALSLQLTQYYGSNAQVLLNVREDNLSGGEGVLGQRPANQIVVQNEIAVLLSDDLMSEVLNSVELSAAPFDDDGSPGMLASLWTRISGQEPEPAAKPSLRERINTLRDTVSVSQIGESLAIKVAVLTGDPDQSATIANRIVERYLEQQIDEKTDVTQRAETFHTERVEEYEARLRAAQDAVDRRRAEVAAIDEDASEEISANYERVRADLDSLKLREAEQRTTLETIRDLVAQGRFLEVAGVLGPSEVASRVREREALSNRIARQSDSDTLGNLTTQLEQLDARILDAIARVDRATESELRRLESRIGVASNIVEQLETRAQVRAQALVDLARLEREAEASEGLYTNYLQLLNATRSESAALSADSRIISSALPDPKPKSPNKKALVALGGIIGLLLGLLSAIFSETFRNTWRKIGDLEDATGVRELASFARAKPRLLQRVLHGSIPPQGTAIMESAQDLQIALNTSPSLGPRTLLMSSTVPGEGKTTTSLLLAMAMQRAGKRALVIECDFYRPMLKKILRAKPDHDLFDVVNQVCSPLEAIYQQTPTSVPVVFARPFAESISVLSSTAFSDMLAAYRQEFDVIILDGPPMVAAADALALVAVADEVVWFYRWDSTPEDDVRDALEKMRRASARITGAVVTMVDPVKERKYHRFGRGRRTRNYAKYSAYTAQK
jgi:uncharacterized protein involved in exopolysaccharide biosynthesis/cellulose biosynthesis protein BcsQ